MGDVLVTLRFGDQLIDVPCENAGVPTESPNELGVPPGYVLLQTGDFEYDNGAVAELPSIGAYDELLVDDDHVAMIQREA